MWVIYMLWNGKGKVVNQYVKALFTSKKAAEEVVKEWYPNCKCEVSEWKVYR